MDHASFLGTVSKAFKPSDVVITISGNNLKSGALQEALISYFYHNPQAWKRGPKTFPHLLTFKLKFTPFNEDVCFGPHLTASNIAGAAFVHLFVINVASADEYRTSVRHNTSEWFSKMNTKSDVQWLIVVDDSACKDKKTRANLMEKVRGDFSKHQSRLVEVFDMKDHSQFSVLTKSVQQAILGHLGVVSTMWERALESQYEKNMEDNWNLTSYFFSMIAYARFYWSLGAVEHAAATVDNLDRFLVDGLQTANFPDRVPLWICQIAQSEPCVKGTLLDELPSDGPLDVLTLRTVLLKHQVLLAIHLYQCAIKSKGAAPSLRTDCSMSILAHTERSLSWALEFTGHFMKNNPAASFWVWETVTDAVRICTMLVDAVQLESSTPLFARIMQLKFNAVCDLCKYFSEDVNSIQVLKTLLQSQSTCALLEKCFSEPKATLAELKCSYETCSSALFHCGRRRLALSATQKLNHIVSCFKDAELVQKAFGNSHGYVAGCNDPHNVVQIFCETSHAKMDGQIFAEMLGFANNTLRRPEKEQQGIRLLEFLEQRVEGSDSPVVWSDVSANRASPISIHVVDFSQMIHFTDKSEIRLRLKVHSSLPFALRRSKLHLKLVSPPSESVLQPKNLCPLELQFNATDNVCRLVPPWKMQREPQLGRKQPDCEVSFDPFDVDPGENALELGTAFDKLGIFSVNEAYVDCLGGKLRIDVTDVTSRRPLVVFSMSTTHKVTTEDKKTYVAGMLQMLRFEVSPSFSVPASVLTVSSPCSAFKFQNTHGELGDQMEVSLEPFKENESRNIEIPFCMEMNSQLCESMAVQKKTATIKWLDVKHNLFLSFVPLLVISSKTSMLQSDILLELEVNRWTSKEFVVELEEISVKATNEAVEEGKRTAQLLSSLPAKCYHDGTTCLIWKLPVKGGFVPYSIQMKYRVVFDKETAEHVDETFVRRAESLRYSFGDEVEISVPQAAFEICTQVLSQQPGAQLCRASSLCHCVVSIRSLDEARKNFFVVLDADDKIWNIIERTKVVTVKESGLGQLALSVSPLVAGFLPFPSVSIYECLESKVDGGDFLPGKALLCFDRTAGRQIRVLFANQDRNNTFSSNNITRQSNRFKEKIVKLFD